MAKKAAPVKEHARISQSESLGASARITTSDCGCLELLQYSKQLRKMHDEVHLNSWRSQGQLRPRRVILRTEHSRAVPPAGIKWKSC
jgi:hypothetical protein